MTSAARQRPYAPQPRDARPRTRGALGNSFRIATIGGIDVSVHISWFVIFALVTWSLATAFFPQAIPGLGDGAAWLLGAIAALLLFASVLVHELAHSFVARARGLGVHSITLFIFGGVSNLTGEAKRPGVEFQVAIVGPLTSFAIAAVAFVVATLAADSRSVVAVAGYLAVVNALLGGFNLIPGFPLDGGRVLRSIVWSATNDLQRATDIAAGVGQLVAWALMLWGFWRVLGGDIFGGIWTAAIGWFLMSASQSAAAQTRADVHLRRLTVADVVRPDATAAPASTTVAELIARYVLPGARRAVPVVDGDRLAGIVTLSDIRDVPEDRRSLVTAAEIMSGPDRLVTVTPTTPLRTAMEALAEGEYEQLPVVDGAGRLVGLVTRADVVRQLQIREALSLDRTSAGRS